MKTPLKLRAIKLRKKGFSYSEIRKNIKVSKSSLSLWLRSVGLTKRQKQKLTIKKIAAIHRGWEKWSAVRINRTKRIKLEAHKDINRIEINKEKLWLMGIMLYWAEGSKQKARSVSQQVVFSNSDAAMINLYIKWAKLCLNVKNENIKFEIYVHENYKKNIRESILYWSKITGYSTQKFDKIYYKKHNLKSARTNRGDNYHGLLRVSIRRSTDINRRISGWIDAICQKCNLK